jgi:hypothetical protein
MGRAKEHWRREGLQAGRESRAITPRIRVNTATNRARMQGVYQTSVKGKRTRAAEVSPRGSCGDDPFKRDNFKDCVLRLMAQVTARGVKRGD